MSFVTHSEFREVLLSLYKDIQKLRQNINATIYKKEKGSGPNKRIAVDAKLDALSSVETRTPRAEQKQQHTYQFWSLFIQLLTLLAVAAYAVITAKMWCEMQTQTRTAQRQLENSDRPWIKVIGIEAASDLQFKSNGDVDISFRPVLKNVGRAVATYVSVNSKLILHDEKGDFFKEPIVRQKEICDEVAKAPLGPNPKITVSMDRTIFPEDTDNDLWYGFTIPKSEVDQRKKNVTLKSGLEHSYSPSSLAALITNSELQPGITKRGSLTPCFGAIEQLPQVF
jgi:hypothetical protein